MVRMPGIKRYRGATIFDDRSPQRQRGAMGASLGAEMRSRERTTQHHNPYDYSHHYRHHQSAMPAANNKNKARQQQQHQQHQQEYYYYDQQQPVSVEPIVMTKKKKDRENHSKKKKKKHAHYSDSILEATTPHVFPVVKLHRPTSRNSGGALGTYRDDEDEDYLTKRCVEKKTTKETEKTVKRKILLGDGRVIEDEPPEVIRDLVEDTRTKEEERYGNRHDHHDHEYKLAHWQKHRLGHEAADDNDVVDESWRRTVNTRDVQENVTQTAATKDLGPVSKRVIDKALRDKRPMREVLEQERERRKAKQRRRERERERQELLLQREQQERLLGGRRGESPEPRREVVYSSKKHRRTVDTEDVRNVSRRLDNGKILTETYKTEEHEVMDDLEEPDSGSDLPSERQAIKDKQGYTHKKRDEFVDYYRVPRESSRRDRMHHLGRGGHMTTEEKRIEKGKHDWDEISERMRRERERLRQRMQLESAERTDALTKKPLNYNQEERTRQKETDKWLEQHFGSDWSLTTPSSLSSRGHRHRSFHRNSSRTAGRSQQRQNSSMMNAVGGPAGASGDGVRRSMSFSSIPISYAGNNNNSNNNNQEINRTSTKTKERVTKTTTTTYKPLALGMDNKREYATLTRDVPIKVEKSYHTQSVTPRAKSATLSHPRPTSAAAASASRHHHHHQQQQQPLLSREREKISPTSPRQYHSTLSLTTPQAEYALDEPLRVPARLTSARSTGHLLQHQYLPTELHGNAAASEASGRSRGRKSSKNSQTSGLEKRSRSAHEKVHVMEKVYNQRSASVSSVEEALGDRSRHSFAQHIVEERYPQTTATGYHHESSSARKNSKESSQHSQRSGAGAGHHQHRPLYVTEFRQDNLFPHASENNLLFASSYGKEYSFGPAERAGGVVDVNEIHVGRKKSLLGTSQPEKPKDFLFEDHYSKHGAGGGGGGHVSFADRLSGQHREQTRNSSYHGFRSLERSDGLRSRSYHMERKPHFGSQDDEDEDGTATSSSASGNSKKHRRKARSQSFLVKSTRPQYQYQLQVPRDVYRKGCLEEDYVYDRNERRFVNVDRLRDYGDEASGGGLRHGHSDLRLDRFCSKELVHQQEQLEPQKFKTIIFLNGGR